MVQVPGRRVAVVGAAPAPKYSHPHGFHTVCRVHTIREDELRTTENQQEKEK